MPSMPPCRIAATALAAAPTPITATSSAATPCWLNSWLRKRCVEEPGAVTPIFIPRKSAKLLKRAAARGLKPSTIAG
jgi:hypothetical protein